MRKPQNQNNREHESRNLTNNYKKDDKPQSNRAAGQKGREDKHYTDSYKHGKDQRGSRNQDKTNDVKSYDNHRGENQIRNDAERKGQYESKCGNQRVGHLNTDHQGMRYNHDNHNSFRGDNQQNDYSRINNKHDDGRVNKTSGNGDLGASHENPAFRNNKNLPPRYNKYNSDREQLHSYDEGRVKDNELHYHQETYKDDRMNNRLSENVSENRQSSTKRGQKQPTYHDREGFKSGPDGSKMYQYEQSNDIHLQSNYSRSERCEQYSERGNAEDRLSQQVFNMTLDAAPSADKGQSTKSCVFTNSARQVGFRLINTFSI